MEVCMVGGKPGPLCGPFETAPVHIPRISSDRLGIDDEAAGTRHIAHDKGEEGGHLP